MTIMFFTAIRADAVREFDIDMCTQIFLNRLPISILLADFLAVCTDRQQALELNKLALKEFKYI